jgi:16S rRNA (cytidine1402-2'-O)-methyltransferase
MNKGCLYLIPVTLGDNESVRRVLPDHNHQQVHKIKIFIVEQVRTARRFLKSIGHPVPIDEMIFYELNKHTDLNKIYSYLKAAEQGQDIGLISEAGTPCIADPGALIVEQAHKKNIRVLPLVGPNSIILALMGSGFNGQNFAFHGYLPIESGPKNRKIKELESSVYRNDQTQIFIETPYRNNKLMETLVTVLKPETKICVAADLTLNTEFIKTLSAGQWKKKMPDLHKRPVVFLIYK